MDLPPIVRLIHIKNSAWLWGTSEPYSRKPSISVPSFPTLLPALFPHSLTPLCSLLSLTLFFTHTHTHTHTHIHLLLYYLITLSRLPKHEAEKIATFSFVWVGRQMLWGITWHMLTHHAPCPYLVCKSVVEMASFSLFIECSMKPCCPRIILLMVM